METVEKVKHIAKLANLNVDNDLEKMQVQLSDILKEIDKILSIEVDGKIMYTPSVNTNVYNDDVDSESVDSELLFKNSKNKYDNYIRVSKVIE